MFTIRYTVYPSSFAFDPHAFQGHDRLEEFFKTACNAWQRDAALRMVLEPGDGTRYTITFADHGEGRVLIGANHFATYAVSEFLMSTEVGTPNQYTDCLVADLFNCIVNGKQEFTFYNWKEAKPDGNLNQA